MILDMYISKTTRTTNVGNDVRRKGHSFIAGEKGWQFILYQKLGIELHFDPTILSLGI